MTSCRDGKKKSIISGRLINSVSFHIKWWNRFDILKRWGGSNKLVTVQWEREEKENAGLNIEPSLWALVIGKQHCLLYRFPDPVASAAE